MKGFLSIWVPALVLGCPLVLGCASAILSYPQDFPAFLVWIAQAIIYIAIAPIAVLVVGMVIIEVGKGGFPWVDD